MDKPPRDWSKVKRIKAPHPLNLRLTDEENTQLETITEKLGVSKAGYVKSMVFGRPIPKTSKRPKAVEADLRQLLGLMGKLGSNANQIARLANSGTITDQQEAADSLKNIQAELTAMRGLLLKALNGEP
jgi:hypothetical protein